MNARVCRSICCTLGWLTMGWLTLALAPPSAHCFSGLGPGVDSLPRPEWNRRQRGEHSGRVERKDYNWRVELPGIGHSAPVFWGDKIF